MAKHQSVVAHLFQREIGLTQYNVLDTEGTCKLNTAHVLAEDKATIPTKNQACELSGQTRSTFLTAFSPNACKLASTHGDHTVRVTEIKTGRCTNILSGHPRTPWCLAFHPASDDILASGCLGGEVHIWDLRGGGSEVWKSDRNMSIASLAFHPSDQMLVFAVSNELFFWDWTQPQPFAKCSTNSEFEKIRWVRFDPLGHRLYTGISNRATVYSEDDQGTHTAAGIGAPDRLRQRNYHSIREEYLNLHRARAYRIRAQDGTPRPIPLTPATASTVPTSEASPSVSLSTPIPSQASAFSARHLEGRAWELEDLSRPHSPVHLEALDNARQYASVISQQHGGTLSSTPLITVTDTTVPATSQASAGERTTASSNQDNSESGASVSSAFRLQLRMRLYGTSGAADRTGQSTSSSPQTGPGSSGSNVSDSNGSSSTNVAAENNDAGRVTVVNVRIPLSSHSRSDAGSRLDRLSRTTLAQPRPSAASGTSSTAAITDTSAAGRATAMSFFMNQLSTAASSLAPTVTLSSSTAPQGRFNTRNIIQPVTIIPACSTAASSSSAADAVPVPASSAAVVSSSPSTGYLQSIRQHLATSAQVASSSATMSQLLRPRPSHLSSSDINTIVTSSSLSGSAETSTTTSSSAASSSIPLAQPNLNSSSNPNPNVDALMDNIHRGIVDDMDSILASPSGSPVVGSQAENRNSNTSHRSSRLRPLDKMCPAHNRHSNPSCIMCKRIQSGGMTGRHFRRLRRSMSNPSSLGSSVTEVDREGSSTSQSLAADVHSSPPSPASASSSNSSSQNPTGRQPPRLSSIMETEVRNTLNRILARRVDISETLLNLENLHQQLYPQNSDPLVSNVPPAESTASASNNREIGLNNNNTLSLSQEGDSLPLSQEQNVMEVEDDNEAAEGTSSSSSTIDVANVPSPDIIPQGSSPSSMAVSLEAIGAYSSEIERQVEQLDSRIARIQNSLDQRILAHQQEREQQLSRIQDSRAQRLLANQQRLRQRYRRVWEQLEDIQRRYRRTDQTSPQEGRSASVQQVRMQARQQAQDTWRDDRNWLTLQRRGLHPHYSVSILDETVNRQNDGLQAAINRAIAGAYMASGESSIASNISNTSYRIQWWDFTSSHIPDLTQSEENIVVPQCKLHNDASCDLSADGKVMAVFVPSHRGFPDDNILAVFSLQPATFKQCLYTKSFGPNAISVSLSPLNNFVLVGLASKRISWVFTPKQMVAQVYKVTMPNAGEDSMEHICDLMHPCDMDIRAPVSMNSASWLPAVGEGIVYGTNRGDLHICRPGFEHEPKRNAGDPIESSSIRRNLMQMLGLTVPRTISTATQTVQRVRRTASTQTDSQMVPSHHHDSD